MVSSYKGKEITVLLAIQYEGQVTEYSFVFEIIKSGVTKGNEGQVDGDLK